MTKKQFMDVVKKFTALASELEKAIDADEDGWKNFDRRILDNVKLWQNQWWSVRKNEFINSEDK